MTDDELKELEKEKARLTLDNKKLESQRLSITKEIDDLEKFKKKVLSDIEKAKDVRDRVLAEIDKAQERVRECNTIVATKMGELKNATKEAEQITATAILQKSQLDKEKAKHKEKVIAFTEKVKNVEIDKTDYKKSEAECNKKADDFERKKERLNTLIVANELLKSELNDKIDMNILLEQSYHDKIATLELETSNYTDQKNRITEAWAKIDEANKAIEKQKRKSK